MFSAHFRLAYSNELLMLRVIKMKSKAYNTTVPVAHSVPCESYLNLFTADEFIKNIIQYHQCSNLIHSLNHFELRIAKSRMGQFTDRYIKDHSINFQSDHMFADSQLVALDSYIKAYLQDPVSYGAHPFVDTLHFTLGVTEKIVVELRQIVKTIPKTRFKLCATGPTKQIKNNKEAFERYAKFRNSLGADITLYWGMKDAVRVKRKNHRLAKISLNPSRFSKEELSTFFCWLKSNFGENGDKIISSANVTRVDIAMDMVGVYIPYLLLERSGNTLIDVYHNIIQGMNRIGTVTLGSKKSSCTRVYDKMRKLLECGPKFIPLLRYAYSLQPFHITRIERQIKPADSTPFLLIDMAKKAQFFLLDTDIYSPLILGHLASDDLKHVWENGFSHWLRSGGKQKLDEELLNSYKLQLNKSHLHKLQVKELKCLLKIILDA